MTKRPGDTPVTAGFGRTMQEAFDKTAELVFTSNIPVPEEPPLTAESLLATMKRMQAALQPIPTEPGTVAGLELFVRTAQEQRRTAQDVRGSWVRPGRVPSKRSGRPGTRRAWKRQHPPGYTWLYREPTDVLVLKEQRMAIVTPQQRDAINKAIDAQR